MSEHPAVVFLQQAHARAEELARAATPGPWEARPPTDHGDGWEVCGRGPGHNESRWVVGAESGGGVYDEADTRLIVANDPAAVLRRVSAERELLADFLAEPHQVVEDCWYTCAAATEERDGGETCRDDMKGTPCECGRDASVERRVLLLAAGWGWAEDAS